MLTHLEEGTSITWRQPQPGGHLLVGWSLREVPGGTELTQRVSVAGAASALFAQTAAKPIASDFAENCARLYTLAGGTATQETADRDCRGPRLFGLAAPLPTYTAAGTRSSS